MIFTLFFIFFTMDGSSVYEVPVNTKEVYKTQAECLAAGARLSAAAAEGVPSAVVGYGFACKPEQTV